MMNEREPDQPVAPLTPSSGSGGGGPSRLTPIVPSLPKEDLTRDPFLMQLKKDDQGRPVLGRIPLHRRIGRGGMGAVYYGIHPRLQIEVAVKVLPFHLIDLDPKFVERFIAEARMAASLNSEHVARVLDVDQDGSTYYLVMEYVAGESAGMMLKRRKSEGKPCLDEREAIAVVTAATRGLAAAHDMGIIHRDIKPDNILIPRGQLEKSKLTDLGLARAAMEGQSLGTLSNIALGTPGYMAPEQVDDAKTAGPEADIFSMGATLYALLSGQAPFAGEKLGAILRQTATTDPTPLPSTVSPVTRAVVARCLAKDARQRYPNGRALLLSLEMILLQSRDSTIITPPSGMTPTPIPSGPPQRPGRGWLVPVSIGLGIALLATVIALIFGGTRTQNPLKRAEALEQAGEFDNALAVLNESLKRNPNDPNVKTAAARLTEKANTASRYRGYWVVAEDLSRNAEVSNTSEEWIKVVLAWSHVEQYAQTEGEKEKLKDMSSQAQQRRDWAAAREMEATGDLKEAMNLIEKAAGIREAPPELKKYHDTLSKKLQTSDVARKQQFEVLAAQAKKEKDLKSAMELWKKALALADEEQDQEDARMYISTLEAKLSKNPDTDRRRAEEQFKEGNAKLDKEDYDAAIKAYTRAIQLNPRHADAYIYRNVAYQQLGDLNKALADCNQAIQIQPVEPSYYAQRASVFYSAMNLFAASRDCNKAIELDSGYDYAYGLRGVLKRHQGDYQGSVKDLTRAIQLASHDASKTAEYTSKRAWTHWEFGHYPEAEADYQTAMKADPNRVETYNEVGWYYIRIKQYGGAADVATQAMKIDPNSSNSYNVRGYARMLAKDLKGSLEDYNKMVELAPRSTVAYASRGYVQARLGQFKEAETNFEKARQFYRSERTGFWTEYWSAAAEALKAKKTSGPAHMEVLNQAMVKLEYAMKLHYLDGDCMCHAYQKDHLKDDPDFAELRSNARFKLIVGGD